MQLRKKHRQLGTFITAHVLLEHQQVHLTYSTLSRILLRILCLNADSVVAVITRAVIMGTS